MTTSADGTAQLRAALEQFVCAADGTVLSVESLAPMPGGHAGLTYGFRARYQDHGTKRFILKMAPKGVPRRGSTDIFRQERLLRFLDDAGYPVPKVKWACPEDAPLGAPFIVMEHLPGRTFFIWSPASLPKPEDFPHLWLETAGMMGRLHALPWSDHLADWEQPVTLHNELARWARLLRHLENVQARDTADRLFEALRLSAPSEYVTGVIHGDFQPGNILFSHCKTNGVIDWDLSSIGPVGVDIGWLLMMVDRDSWASGWQPAGASSIEDLLDAYWQAGGVERQNLRWFQAFAHARMAAIAGLNLKLHRDGRRVDDVWEKFLPSVPILLRNAFTLIGVEESV